MIELSGLEQFKKELEYLDKRIRNKLIRQAQRKAMKLLASEIKAEAPKDTGLTARSVKVKAGKRKKDTISTIVQVGDESNPMVGFVELGTKHQPANPFVRHSVARKTDDIIDILGTEIADGIAKNS